LIPSLLWPAHSQRLWQQAFVNKVERKVVESESVDFGHRTTDDAFSGPVVTGIRKISVIRWIVTIRTDKSVLIGAYERTKLPSWLRGDDRMEAATRGDYLYLKTSDRKEHQLDLVSVQPVPEER